MFIFLALLPASVMSCLLFGKFVTMVKFLCTTMCFVSNPFDVIAHLICYHCYEYYDTIG